MRQQLTLNTKAHVIHAWDEFNYNFELSGEEEQGLLFPAPRMLVCPRTPVLGFESEASKEQKQLVILGIYQPD